MNKEQLLKQINFLLKRWEEDYDKGLYEIKELDDLTKTGEDWYELDGKYGIARFCIVEDKLQWAEYLYNPTSEEFLELEDIEEMMKEETNE